MLAGLTPLSDHTLFVAPISLDRFHSIDGPSDLIVGLPRLSVTSPRDLWLIHAIDIDGAALDRTIMAAVQKGEPVHETFRIASSAGSIPITLRLLPARDDAGRIEHVFGTVVDESAAETASMRRAAEQDEEVLIGARIQRALLFGRTAERRGPVTIVARTLPSQQIDGDFFDTYSHSADTIDLVIGDVMGKGIAAALMGAAVKTAYMRAMLDLTADRDAFPAARVAPPLDAVVAATERQLSRELLSIGRFVTMNVSRFVFSLDLLEFVDCGHTYVLHYSAVDQTTWMYDGSNMPIGFFEAQTFEVKRVPLRPGDVLFYYSDGITEAVNSEGVQFGEERLQHFLNGHHMDPPDRVVADLVALVFDYFAGGVTDDVTAVLVKLDRSDAGRPLPRSRVFAIGSAMVAQVRAFCEQQLTPDLGSANDRFHVLHALQEAVANIWVHAFGRGEHPKRRLSVSFEHRDPWLFVTLTYQGHPYLLDATAPTNGADYFTDEYAEHGYGLQIIKTTMDSVVLAQGLGGMMRLVMAKRLSGDEGEG